VQANAIAVEGLTRRFGRILAVDQVSFVVGAGTVTAFLGLNGAGKTTTIRCLLGLVTPTAGSASILGRCYADLAAPSRTVGALLEDAGGHPGRSARAHLHALALAGGVPSGRVDEVLELVGLGAAARRRVGGFSTGMRRRLGLAAALLGRPRVLVLDEPASGLDPEGVRWLRELLRGFAADGGAVLVSSHVLGEVAEIAQRVVVIHRGRLVADTPLGDLLGGGGGVQTVRVGTPAAGRLRRLLTGAGAAVTQIGPDTLEVTGRSPARVGAVAGQGGIELHELTASTGSLEEVFLKLTAQAEARGPRR
jgi:ABC-2 type transport system ATP-binding protein